MIYDRESSGELTIDKDLFVNDVGLLKFIEGGE